MKLSKYEAREYRKKKLERQLKGEGLYVFRNASKADLYLPKPAQNNVKVVPPGAEFQGDSYFLETLVKTNQARLVRTLITPEQERKSKMEEKLIVDQPDTVTQEGKVEHVVVGTAKPLNEVGGACKKTESVKPADVLLNEDPMDGVDILG